MDETDEAYEVRLQLVQPGGPLLPLPLLRLVLFAKFSRWSESVCTIETIRVVKRPLATY